MLSSCLAVIVVLPATLGCGPDRPRPRNAIVIVLDTLRADRMSVYGSARPTTPRLEALAADAVVFDQVVTNASWTLPAMAGLLAGQYIDNEVLAARLEVSLVERLRAAGYRTAAFTEGGFVSRRYGLALGFDVFDEQTFVNPFTPGAKPEVKRQGAEIVETFDRAKAWLAAQEDQPFFLLVHTYETHTPYVRRTYARDLDPDGLGDEFSILSAALVTKAGRPISEAQREYIAALYDGGVLEADRHVGELLDHLDALGLSDDTIVVVTSDHGESLGERTPPRPGTHGHALHDELVMIPLIIRDPTRRYPVRRVDAQVRSIDTMPTVLDLLGLPTRGGPRAGQSLRPLMEGRDAADRPAWMRVVQDGFTGKVHLYGLRAGDRKIVVDAMRPEGSGSRVSFFDLSVDPGEANDLSSERAAERDQLLEELRALRAVVEEKGVPGMRVDAETAGEQADQLRALGYIE